MSADEQRTCGKGLAASAGLPAKLGELMETMAEMLERHTRALDPGETAGQAELKEYQSLVQRHREVATGLKVLAVEMEGYRELPMASHDMAVMQDPQGQAEAFGRVVEIERELVGLLEGKTKEAEEMMR
ncbi:MAG TPA: hypothetical protein VFN74_05630 [Chloroflexota bacterium]|nr:hypothetical protein [Chloroflexota bacterium]